ncbi:MAG: branched-chain amino acid aminotransferase [Alphaproteobacteria bacterium]
MGLIPYDDRDGLIWMDGELVEWRSAKMHICSHSLHYASAVFEGERAYGGTVFKLREHSERLIQSAKTLDIPLKYTPEEVDEITMAAVRANNIVDGYVRPIVWRGAEQMGVAARGATVHFAVACWEWPAYFGDEAIKKGISLKTASWKRPSPETAPVHAKAAGLYMIATLSKHEAEREGFSDALMHDWRGQVAECTGANVFVIKDGVIHTPIPDCFLDGITRRTVMEIARARGIEVIERVIMPDELHDADEIFVTGTAAEVTPVGRIDDRPYKVGEITMALRDAYLKLVNLPEDQQVIEMVAAE